jgi:hypothetical protein
MSKPLTQPELETVCFLACKPGKTFSGEALRSAIGAGRDEDWSARSVITYANGLRRKLGAEHVPDATSAGGYCLVGVSTDAARFKELTTLAKGEHGVEQARYLAEALSLVRGAPFSDVPKATYGWAHRPDRGPSLADDLANTTVDAARALARLGLDARDHDLASWAVLKGHIVWQTDLELAKLQLDTATISPDASELSRTWSDLTKRFAGNNTPVPDDLTDYYRRLRDR